MKFLLKSLLKEERELIQDVIIELIGEYKDVKSSHQHMIRFMN